MLVTPAYKLQCCCPLQSLEGKPSGALCGSELVCAFDRKVLPEWQARLNPSNRAAYKEKCVAFAKKLGLPDKDWASITLPVFFSLDHDTRHAWVFQRLSGPRVPAAKLEAMFAEVIKDVLGLDLPPLPQAQIHDLVGDLDAGREAAAVRARRNQILQQWDQHCTDIGRDPWQEKKWDLARTRPEFICIGPKQRFPLVPVTPDANSPAEHMVRSVKAEVREYVLNMDPASPLLRKGVTYQRMINRAVQVRGNGARGLHQIRRSIAKLPCIFKILAAELNEKIEVEFDFDTKPTVNERAGKAKKGVRKKTSIWQVLGRAGRWIRTSKWR